MLVVFFMFWYNSRMGHRFFVKEIDNTKALIEGEEFNHLSRVLRLKNGDAIEGLCGDYILQGKICEMSNKQAVVEITSKEVNCANPKNRVVVFQGLPKGDKMDLIVQKLSELGISEIIPFESSFCIAKPNSSKIDRLNKISEQACKQCGRSIPLVVAEALSFKKLLEKIKEYDTVLFANETEKKLTSKDVNGTVAIIVGSEGGFSEKECQDIVDAGAVSISLGNRILRTETASIVMSALVMNMLGELG